MNRMHLYVLAGAAVAGFFLANAPSTTGIYGLPLGQTFANLYQAGAKIGNKASPAAQSA